MTPMTSDPRAVSNTLAAARALLLDQRVPGGWWEGQLSSSALSTATACAALALVSTEQPQQAPRLAPAIRAGRAWLAKHASPDGGFGDTPDSPSNLSTTALAWLALGMPNGNGEPHEVSAAHESAAAWIEGRVGRLDVGRLAAGLAEVYGEDKTFAVPILSACILGGAFGDDRQAWSVVPELPFELAALPQRLFKWLGLPVVSYAMPALIAIGQAIEHHHPTPNPFARLARACTRARTLRVLERIQPPNGGFLEATPLTSFVVLSLASSGRVEHPVVSRGVEFLLASMRSDGSWPIDTNLATWVTTLAINGLGESGHPAVKDWLLGQQLRGVHPYTGAEPGGWAWTDLPGGVPDADDTAGALLALRVLAAEDSGVQEAARAGLNWLARLQNRDGGIPTFCKGWGRLPFDQSCPDLTAHALRAWSAWAAEASHARGIERGVHFLVRTQAADGSWVPLWFGNQDEEQQRNPVYGTSRVLRAVACAPGNSPWRAALARGLEWLRAAQAEDGGFGGAPGLGPTLEETALALEALCDCHEAGLANGLRDPIQAAATWLVRATEGGTRFEARPIGLYFASLWYSERLYPLVFCVSALGRAERVLES
jgi:squalene-hopene/tetraprenyl-beta-curcumene cyclase